MARQDGTKVRKVTKWLEKMEEKYAKLFFISS
jgi:hypothetical protein